MKKQVLIFVLAAFTSFAYSQSDTYRVNKQLEIFNDVLRELDISYVDTLDYETIIELAINQMLKQVDPYTIYYSEQDSKKLREMTTGQYGGIGSVIQQRGDSTFIANPYENMPAQRAGLMAGDRILNINGESVKGLKVGEVSRKLRGVPGTTITIDVLRPGEKKSRKFSFQREEIRMSPVPYYCAYKADSLSRPVGYIAFDDFTDNSARDFEQALDQLIEKDHIGSLIIDLRGNGGGLIGQAVDLVNLFVDKNTVVVDTKGKHDEPLYTYRTRSNVKYPDLPLVIMVNKNTASAAEIVCGALQDLGRATLIGQRTFGKGLVQSIRSVVHNGSLKVTTARYYLPSGRCIQAIDYAERQKGNDLKKDTAGGILPDIVLNDSVKVDVSYALYTKDMFFDFATLYRQRHPSIAEPTEFELSEADMQEFLAFLKERKFEYETETSKYIKELLKVAHQEDLDSSVVAQLEAFEKQIKPDYVEAIQRNEEHVKNLLGREIVLRYFYQKGQIAYSLRFDLELKRALKEADNLLQRRKP